ncbi:hypothetical protein Tco_0024476 [Tanacetum coccineum]
MSDQDLLSLIFYDSCISDRDFSLSLMGKVKYIISMPNLYVILEKEDLQNLSLTYLGGLWVLIETVSNSSKEKLLNHTGSVYWVHAKEMEAWDPSICNDSFEKKDSGDDLKYPPGFTPSVINMEEVNEKEKRDTSNKVNEHVNSNSNKLKESVPKGKFSSNNSVCSKRVHTRDSILQLIDELVQETKIESMKLVTIKTLWGNSSFDYALSPSLGNSGGILCVWDPTLFVKDNVTSSDNFLAVIDRWDGDYVIIGDLINLIDLPLDGYAYTWAHKTANKMSKLDRFLVSKEDTWKSLPTIDSNGMINLKKKLQALKIIIRQLTKNAKKISYKAKISIQSKLSDIDKILDQGGCNEEILFDRSLLLKELNNINSIDSLEAAHKSKVRWVIEGDENTKFFHGILNSVFLKYFSTQLSSPVSPRICFADQFTNRYWKLLEHDIVAAVKEFFASCTFPPECLFSGIPIDSSLTLSHLFFADYDIFIGKWESLNISTIVNVLKCFHLASGLKIKFHKSKLMGIGTLPEEVDAAATTMGCSIFTTLFVHLGVKVEAIYGEDSALNSPSSLSKRSPWLDIIREVTVLHIKYINLLDLIHKKVRNGLNTLFWEDPWLEDLALKHKFPRLYALDNYKQRTVVEKINHASMVNTFHRPPRGGAEEEKNRYVQFRRTSLTGFPAQSVIFSNAIALDSPYLLVLITGTS